MKSNANKQDENMKSQEEPKMLIAVLLTIAAFFSLLSIVFMVNHKEIPLLVILLKCSAAALLMFCAIANWVKYAKRYIDFKINEKLSEDKK